VQAIEHGFSVAFYRLEELLHEMRKDADVDRLLHQSVVLNIRGRSYRLQELEKLLKRGRRGNRGPAGGTPGLAAQHFVFTNCVRVGVS
jgi:hypothetical protein